MPLLDISSNKQPVNENVLLQKVSAAVAEMLGKPESYVMVRYQHTPHLIFAGSGEPTAYMELKSIGLPETKTTEFSGKLCALVSSELDVAENRIYIEFADAARHMWGWDGRTFA